MGGHVPDHEPRTRFGPLTLFVFLLLVLSVIILHASGKLPQPVLIFAGDVVAVLGALGILLTILEQIFPGEISKRLPAMLSGIHFGRWWLFALGLIVVPTLILLRVLPPAASPSPIAGASPTLRVTPVPSHGPTLSAQGTPISDPTVTNTPLPTEVIPTTPPSTSSPAPVQATATPALSTLLAQLTPDCNNPEGTVWIIPGTGASTSIQCTSDGLQMQMVRATFAEIDLEQVNGAHYSPSTFDARVDVTFPDPADTTTFATLLTDSPADPNQYGGYSLLINAVGQWRLQQTLSATAFQTLDQGQASIDPTRHTTIAIVVQDGELLGFINGMQVTPQSGIAVASPGIVGLLVECDHAGSSPVLYSNFDLDV